MSLTALQGIQIDEDVLKSHVICPPNIANIITDKGRTQLPPVPVVLPPGPPQAHHLNGQGFCNTLHAALKDSVVGYVMQLQQHGSVIYTLEWNWAQTPSDASEGWNPQIPMHVASLSKMITAMALTKLLIAKGISFDATISSYLPSYWQKGPNVASITFRQLLTHTSGFTSGGADFASVKAQVAAGVTLPKQYQYANSNFSLCRVLLPVIHGDIAVNHPAPLGLDDAFWNLGTIQSYENYVIANVFTPAGSTGSLQHAANAALAYNSPATGKGWNSGDLSTVSGAAGWHFSVAQLLKIMGAFRRGGNILSTVQAQTMLDNEFGIDWKVLRHGDNALVYSKNGLWENGSGQTEQGVAFFLPEDMELVVLVNSPIKASTSFLETVVWNSYNQNIT